MNLRAIHQLRQAQIPTGGGGGLPAGTDVMITGDVTSSGSNEGSTNTAWTATNHTVTSGAPGSDGTFYLNLFGSSKTIGYAEIDIPVENGATYSVSIDVRQGSNGDCAIADWSGVVTSPNIAFANTTNWVTESFNVTANATTMTIRVYSNVVSQSGRSTTQEARVDNIRIIKQ